MEHIRMLRPPDSALDSEVTLLELHRLLMDYAQDEGRDGVNALRLLMVLSGAVVESCFLFDQPNDALDEFWGKLSARLRASPTKEDLPPDFLPAPYVLDDTSEEGRDVVRHILSNFGGEPHAFAGMMADVVCAHLRAMAAIDRPVEETFRVLCEFTSRIMVLEVAAQELCDVLIERKVGAGQWSLGDCISALSGLSGYKVAVWYQNTTGTPQKRARAQAQTFESIVGVMTREAVRYGIPGGTDWRFGLPANDTPSNPPALLVSGVLPFCEGFFKVVRAYDPVFQATACAKAAGRMLAVAAGGDMPELAPAIAKPLAIAAMTESYRSLV